MITYPAETEQVPIFYNESERLVRFLNKTDKKGFFAFLEAMSRSNRIDTALNKGFSARFINLEALEREFKNYATQTNGLTASE